MSPLILLGAVVLAVILAVIALLFMARGAPDPAELINARLAEFSARDEPMTLEEIELSLRFRERVLIPLSSKIGKIAARFTPQATLENARRRLEMAGGTVRMDPAFFLTMRIVVALVFGGMVFIVFIISKRNLLQGMLLTVLFLILGYMFPEMMLTSRIKRRQRAVFRAMPDALDLLTICVEAGLGFDAAMSKVNDKWENDLALEFGRVLQEIRLGKLRRDALRDMSDRLGVPEMTSFVAAVVQSEQLGVSMAKVLKVQSTQMRVRRRQLAEEEAHRAPVKMVFPIGLLIFPSLMIILLGPAIMQLLGSQMGGLFR
ncbi:MAG: type II secretion system F family protein [Anaerolineales bacterium]